MILVFNPQDFNLRGGKVNRSSAEGALVEAPQGAEKGGARPLPAGGGIWEGLDPCVRPLPQKFFIIWPQNGASWCGI